MRVATVLAASGAAALVAEAVFLRRASLALGSSAVGSAVAVGAWLGGLAVGSAAARWLPAGPRAYAALELSAAAALVASPLVFGGAPGPVATALWVAVPALFGGATWPVLCAGRPRAEVAAGYAANTTGAVVGVLLGTFALLPWLGVRGTELAAAAGLAGAALAALGWVDAPDEAERPPPPVDDAGALWVAAALGFASAGLEVWWLRLSAVGLGATVQTHGLVLATHLATVGAGAWLGRSWPADPRRAVEGGAVGFAVLALLGGLTWGQLPYLVARVYPWLGADAWWTASGGLLLLAMGGAPAASAVAFAGLVRQGVRPAALGAASGGGSALGALCAGVWLVPHLEARGTLVALAALAAVAGAIAARRAWGLLPVALLAGLEPQWDARLYAVGIHLRVSDFPDPSPRAVRRFVDEGWELLFYDHGPTAAVAVGRSTRTGNTWLSINGKVDASTGGDMPTQTLSAEVPLARSAAPDEVLVVGLASGVTAGTALRDPRVRHLTVVEIEPAVVEAERFFRHANGDPLSDPRTTLIVGDARAWLRDPDHTFDVIVSEPSNPWITGVSSLFTEEYWQLLRARLRPDGVVCQWIQTYGLGTDELRALLRTFRGVFPDAVVVEPIEGADLLLIAGGRAALRGAGPLPVLVDEHGLERITGPGWTNTDDRPLVEWRAPLWLHHDTSAANRALLQLGAEASGPR